MLLGLNIIMQFGKRFHQKFRIQFEWNWGKFVKADCFRLFRSRIFDFTFTSVGRASEISQGLSAAVVGPNALAPGQLN